MITPNNLIVGVTGTVLGASPEQLATLTGILTTWNYAELRHGDAFGVDAQTHAIALQRRAELKVRPLIRIHPPAVDSKRAYCQGADELFPVTPYLERDHHIVDACHVMIAVPASDVEQLRSGTWATVRYAQKIQRLVLIIQRDGSVRVG